MKELFSIEGLLRSSASRSHLSFSFAVPEGTVGLRFRFSYDPK